MTIEKMVIPFYEIKCTLLKDEYDLLLDILNNTNYDDKERHIFSAMYNKLINKSKLEGK